VNIALWALQIILAAVFFAAGAAKLSQPKEKLRDRMTFVDDYSANGVKLIGGLEVLGAIGLILPRATGIAPVLTPLAALGLAAIMVGAVATHVRRSEQKSVPMVVVLGVVALVVAIARF
jgi:uncharacterized membrane protein YphA (DoxX/SURF4 family)